MLFRSTDTARESQREEVDLAKDHQREVTGISPTRLDKKLLVQEREGSDKSQAVERGEEDRARTEERVQKQLIAETEALLEQERKNTDRALSFFSASPSAAPALDQPTTLSSRLVLPSLASQVLYLAAHTSDTTSTSLV